MRVFLAGATGVIGRSLIPRLIQNGHTVTGTTRSVTKARFVQSLGAHPFVLDVFNRDAVLAALRQHRPDIVIHQLTDLSAYDLAANARLRIEGTRNLVDAASAAGINSMVAQSISFAYAPGSAPAREDEPLDVDAPEPRKQTASAVLALEHAVSEMPHGVVLRYGTLYGPDTWYASTGLIAQRVRQNELIANDGVTSFLHVVDAANAALLALDWPSGAYNIVDDEPAPAKEWLPIYAAAIGVAMPASGNGGRRGERGASNVKARKQLGWQPLCPTWREGFRTALG